MKIRTWEIGLLLVGIVLALSGFAAEREADALSEKLIRLHVVASSDTEEDQALKLAVRDAVLTELEPVLHEAEDREQAVEAITARLSQLRALAETISGQSARVSLETELLPTTRYATFALPGGEYLSLRIVLGAGEGHNWWCVVFPKLCGDTELMDAGSLTEGELKLITGNAVVRFRSLELLGKLKQLLRGGKS